jgi:hypothetical protein
MVYVCGKITIESTDIDYDNQSRFSFSEIKIHVSMRNKMYSDELELTQDNKIHMRAHLLFHSVYFLVKPYFLLEKQDINSVMRMSI